MKLSNFIVTLGIIGCFATSATAQTGTVTPVTQEQYVMVSIKELNALKTGKVAELNVHNQRATFAAAALSGLVQLPESKDLTATCELAKAYGYRLQALFAADDVKRDERAAGK
jgi:hypothetical protein